MRSFIYFLLLTFTITGYTQTDSLRKYYQMGISEYEQTNYQGFLENMIQAGNFRPNYPPIIYNIGAGYALTGDETKAVAYLKTYLTFNSLVDFQSDNDFENIKNSESFQQVINLAEKLSEKINNSQPYLTIEGTSHIESIAINENDGTLFLGDVRERKVYQYSKNEGLKSLLNFKEFPELFSVMGLDFDEQNQKLWICSAALPQTLGFDEKMEGWSSLFSYDLKSKKTNHHGTLKNGNSFGDLTVSKSGKIYISDGGTNRIYSLDPSGELQVFADLSDKAYNLQGLALSEDEQTIFISDYILGLFKLEINSKIVSQITFELGIPFKGIDGLYYKDQSLFAIQNGTIPIRTIQLFLNPDASKVLNYVCYDQHVNYLNEPTQGFVDDRNFIYISNSPWGNYNDQIELTGEAPLMLRKIKIK